VTTDDAGYNASKTRQDDAQSDKDHPLSDNSWLSRHPSFTAQKTPRFCTASATEFFQNSPAANVLQVRPEDYEDIGAMS
jgi:hypothetical protein